MTPLYGHTSPETAHLIDDYPYSFRLRCKMRCWVETHPKHGFRMVRQTTNPKKGDRWNKPHASTYTELAACMYIDDEGHVQWTGIGVYTEAEKVRDFVNNYPKADLSRLVPWVIQKQALCEKLSTGEAYFTMNGTRTPRSEAQREDDKREAAVWAEVRAALDGIGVIKAWHDAQRKEVATK